jgi:hypothetical protein
MPAATTAEIVRAIRRVLSGMLDDREAVDRVVRAAASASLTERDKLAMLREAELRLGRREAVGALARKLADPADPRAVASVERSLRRLRQTHSDNCPSPDVFEG